MSDSCSEERSENEITLPLDYEAKRWERLSGLLLGMVDYNKPFWARRHTDAESSARQP